MSRFAITAIVKGSQWKIDILLRKLKLELKRPSVAKWIEVEEISIAELKE